MASRDIGDLSPVVQAMALAFLRGCRSHSLDVLIYCTLRSNEEQSRIYASGRTMPGPILTNARAGESLHNPDTQGKAWAFDAVPMVAGKCLWDDRAALVTMGRAGELVGLEWAGRWSGKLRESVHFQLRNKGKS